jgi:hypothetical protein
MDTDEENLKAAWNQTEIPIVLRRGGKGQRLRVRLPYSDDNGAWLRNGRPRKPRWFSGEGKNYWELPKAWFNDFVNRALKVYGKVYIVQPYREQEVCARACMEATGHECECSCMGANHGSGVDNGWYEVSDYFAVRSSRPQLACRLMVAKGGLDQ